MDTFRLSMHPSRAAKIAVGAAALTILAVPMLACGFGGDDDRTTYPLPRCGMQIELGAHFSQTEHGPDRYAFRTQDGSIELSVEPAVNPDPTVNHDPATLVPLATSYDYDRTRTFAGFPAREVRTQAPMGAQIRARWGAAIDTPQGTCLLRVTSLWEEGPDEMGEAFWTALHDRWLTAL